MDAKLIFIIGLLLVLSLLLVMAYAALVIASKDEQEEWEKEYEQNDDGQ